MAYLGLACAPELEILWRRADDLARQIDSLRLGTCPIGCDNGANNQHQSTDDRTMERFRRIAPIGSKSY
jgi:hypothetical protein